MLLLIARHDDRPNVVVDHIVKPLYARLRVEPKKPDPTESAWLSRIRAACHMK
jgi:hypothetical protein